MNQKEAERRVEVETKSVATHHDLGLTQAELATLLQIGQALSTHRDRHALFSAIAQAIEGRLPADRLIILIPDSQGDHVYAPHGAAKLYEGERIRKGSVPAWVIRERRAMVVSSVEEVRETFPATFQKLVEEGMQSVVVLPLLAKGQCLGAVSLMARAPGAWDGYPRRFLDEIGSSVAAALDNCLAHEQQQRMNRESAVLLDVNRAVGRHLHRDELFGALAACLRQLLRTDRFGIELPIEDDRLQGHLLTPHGDRTEPTQPHVLPASGTACDWVLQNRKWLVADSREELRERFPVTFEVMSREAMESLCAMPLVTGDRSRGVLFFMAASEGAYGDVPRGLLDQVASAVAVALDDCLAHEEVRRLRDQLAAENVYLQEEILQEHNFGDFVGRSPKLLQVLSRVDTVAPTSSTVLILGETGTGKELIARAIHDRSPRRERPLVKVNCAAISAGLVESELFGHMKGAFTGAVAARSGRFELADKGTIFLDEIGELPLETQVKLLRVLQEREFEPVGSDQTRQVDVRVIAATNRHLQAAVAEGRFRQDLYYRLNVFPVYLPPLRERPEDIPLLVNYFVGRYAAKIGRKITTVPPQAMAQLTAYGWPGNVRELENVIERVVILSAGPELEIAPEVLPLAAEPPVAHASTTEPPQESTLGDVQRNHILAILRRTNWRIDGPEGAARILNLKPSTLRSRIKKLGIRRSAEKLS